MNFELSWGSVQVSRYFSNFDFLLIESNADQSISQIIFCYYCFFYNFLNTTMISWSTEFLELSNKVFSYFFFIQNKAVYSSNRGFLVKTKDRPLSLKASFHSTDFCLAKILSFIHRKTWCKKKKNKKNKNFIFWNFFSFSKIQEQTIKRNKIIIIHSCSYELDKALVLQCCCNRINWEPIPQSFSNKKNIYKEYYL